MISPAGPVRFWRCRQGHILGYVDLEKGKNHIRVFRDALSSDQDPGDVLSESGPGTTVWCSICGGSRKWFDYKPGG